MAGNPDFNHIHCSSRFDRSASLLEADLDKWMAKSSVITLTEVSNDAHAAKMREKGWGYFNAAKSNGQDDAGIAWRRDTWYNPWRAVRKLQTKQYMDIETGKLATDYVHAAAVTLKHVETGVKLLVSVARMPSGLQAASGWNTLEKGWQARKTAYIEANITWSRWIESVRITQNADAVMVVGDWNLDLKATWVREFLRQHWGELYILTWRHFPTAGSGLGGGRIIDGTLAMHLDIEEDTAYLMDEVKSSDHRPYTEHLKYRRGSFEVDPITGDIYGGTAWWGFGDYQDDEIYTIPKFAGAAGGEVL